MKINGAGRRRRPREMHHAIVKFLFHYAYTLAVNGKTILLRLLLGKRTRTNEKSELKINFEKKKQCSLILQFQLFLFRVQFSKWHFSSLAVGTEQRSVVVVLTLVPMAISILNMFLIYAAYDTVEKKVHFQCASVCESCQCKHPFHSSHILWLILKYLRMWNWKWKLYFPLLNAPIKKCCCFNLSKYFHPNHSISVCHRHAMCSLFMLEQNDAHDVRNRWLMAIFSTHGNN